MDIKKIKNGDHCWAISNDQLLIVLKTEGRFEVCGAWECGIRESDIKIIEVIKKPKKAETTKLYYDFT